MMNKPTINSREVILLLNYDTPFIPRGTRKISLIPRLLEKQSLDSTVCVCLINVLSNMIAIECVSLWYIITHPRSDLGLEQLQGDVQKQRSVD